MVLAELKCCFYFELYLKCVANLNEHQKKFCCKYSFIYIYYAIVEFLLHKFEFG